MMWKIMVKPDREATADNTIRRRKNEISMSDN
jgi:hypothetical protein